MSITGKYGATLDSVTVTSDVEDAITSRLPEGASYDGYSDVLFYSVSDGIVIEIPIIGGVLSKYVLNFSDKLLEHQQQFLVDLKAIREAGIIEATTRKDKVADLYTE